MINKLSIAVLLLGAGVAVAPAVAHASPILTITGPAGAIGPTPLSGVYTIPSGQDISGSIAGASIPSASNTGINEISFASINITNTTSSQQSYTIDVSDNSFTANGSLSNELYQAIETFGGEVNTGTADMTFTTTAFTNSSSASVTQTENITAGTGGTSFGTGQGTSAPTLVLSPGDQYTIDSSMQFTLTAGASLELSQLNYNGYSGTIPTGTTTPEPQSAALALGGMLPLFFVKRRKAGSR